jgi:hypothetical protein
LTPVELPSSTGTPQDTRDGRTEACTDADSRYRRDDPPVDDLPADLTGLDCPDFDWADETVCYQTATRSSADVLLVGGGVAVIDDRRGDVTEFVLLNRSTAPVRVRPDEWSILSRERRGWSTLLSGRPGCLRTLREGRAHWWSVGVDTTTTDARDNVTPVSMGLLPGTYALSVPVRASGDRDIACLAPFEVRETFSDTGQERRTSKTEQRR